MKKIFLIIGLSLIISCSKDSEDTPIVPPASVTDDNSIAYFKAALNGQQFDYVMTNSLLSTHAYQPSISITSTNVEFERAFSYGAFMYPYPKATNGPEIELSFNNMYKTFNLSTETAAFPNLFNPIPTNFLTSDQNSIGGKGIELSYTNSSGTYYSTLNGSQIGSLISFSNVNLVTGNFNLKAQIITGTINCKLYNYENLSDVVTVTNGKFKLIFQENN